jgi:plastocyanin
VALAAVIVRGPAPVVAAEGSGAEQPAAADIRLAEWTIDGDLSLKPGATSFSIANEGTVAHNFSIVGVATSEDISTGETTTLDVADLPAGTYEVICAIAGHKEAGMQTMLTVADNATGAGTSAHGDHGGHRLGGTRCRHGTVDPGLPCGDRGQGQSGSRAHRGAG